MLTVFYATSGLVQYAVGCVALPPPDRHLQGVREACTRAGLDAKYLEWLSSLPVIPYNDRTREYYLAERNPLLQCSDRVKGREEGVCNGVMMEGSGQLGDSGYPEFIQAGPAGAGKTVPTKSGKPGRRKGRLQHGWL